MYRFGPRSASAIIVLLLLSIASSPAVFGSPTTVAGSISIDSPVEIVPNRNSETPVNIPGSFRVDTKDGPDTLLTTSADLSISGGSWTASLSETHWEDIQEGMIYQFTVTIVLPNGTTAGESSTFTLALVFTNLLGTSTPETAPLNIILMQMPNGDNDPDEGPDDNSTTEIPSVENPFPIWIIFIVGLIILLLIGFIWALRNLQMVVEDDGGRRIMMKERKSYSKKDMREPPPEEDQLL
jgi:hypothetical protein